MMTIGIFDSGNGGLSVLLEALKQLPEANFIFYGDTTHVPYGEKSEEEVLGFVEEAMDFFVSKKVDAVVLACNTATSVACEQLRQEYDFPIIGMEPAAKKALDYNDEKRTLVIATPITVRGKKLQSLIGKYDKHHLVDLHAMPGLVRYAEAEEYSGEEVDNYIRKELQSYSWEDYASLVLGCTHFNYFKEVLREIIPEHVVFLDGNEGTVRQLKRKLALELSQRTEDFRISKAMERVEIYYSGAPKTSKEDLEALERRLAWLDRMWDIK